MIKSIIQQDIINGEDWQQKNVLAFIIMNNMCIRNDICRLLLELLEYTGKCSTELEASYGNDSIIKSAN